MRSAIVRRLATVALVLPLMLASPLGWAQSAPLQTYFMQPASGNQTLPLSWANLNGLSLSYSVDTPSLVTVFGHVGYENMNASDDDSNCMVAIQAVDENGRQIPGSFHTTNLDRARHYEDMVVLAQYSVQPGDHQMNIQGYMKNFPNWNITVVVKNPDYAGVNVRIEPLPTSLASAEKQGCKKDHGTQPCPLTGTSHQPCPTKADQAEQTDKKDCAQKRHCCRHDHGNTPCPLKKDGQ